MKSKTLKRHREKVQSDPMYGCRECPDFKADRLKHILHKGRANMSLQRHVMQIHPEHAKNWQDFRVDAERRPRANRKAGSEEWKKVDKVDKRKRYTVQTDVQSDVGRQPTYADDTDLTQDAALVQRPILRGTNNCAFAVAATEQFSYLHETRLWQEIALEQYPGTPGWVHNTSYDKRADAQLVADKQYRRTGQAVSSSYGKKSDGDRFSVYPDF